MRTLVATLILLTTISCIFFAFAKQQESQENKQQFIYVLKLIPKLIEAKNWTEKENQIVATHFNHLKQLLKEEKLILAGRTLNEDSSQFGIVILEVTSEEEARDIMERDPAVKEKIMTANLFPYRVALIRETSE